jgi:hypothetical protein
MLEVMDVGWGEEFDDPEALGLTQVEIISLSHLHYLTVSLSISTDGYFVLKFYLIYSHPPALHRSA